MSRPPADAQTRGATMKPFPKILPGFAWSVSSFSRRGWLNSGEKAPILQSPFRPSARKDRNRLCCVPVPKFFLHEVQT
jgi:hypothetical protein